MMKILIHNCLVDLPDVAHVDTVGVEGLCERLAVGGHTFYSLEVSNKFGYGLIH